jgi:SAM-dependent methyltransferase
VTRQRWGPANEPKEVTYVSTHRDSRHRAPGNGGSCGALLEGIGRAARYDFTANGYYLLGFREWAYRKRAVAALGLKPGDTVVEVGCGTGLNFGLLERRLGPEGKIIGVDLTDAMLAQAARRAARRGWRNVQLLQSDAARFAFPAGVAGILSTFALTLSPEFDAIIRRGAEALAPGGRWVVLDLKLPATWAGRLLPVLLPLFRPFGVTADLAARRPWDALAKYLPGVSCQESYFGYVYIAVGEKPRGRR